MCATGKALRFSLVLYSVLYIVVVKALAPFSPAAGFGEGVVGRRESFWEYLDEKEWGMGARKVRHRMYWGWTFVAVSNGMDFVTSSVIIEEHDIVAQAVPGVWRNTSGLIIWDRARRFPWVE